MKNSISKSSGGLLSIFELIVLSFSPSVVFLIGELISWINLFINKLIKSSILEEIEEAAILYIALSCFISPCSLSLTDWIRLSLKKLKSGLYFSANGSSLLFGKSFFLIILSVKQFSVLGSGTIN